MSDKGVFLTTAQAAERLGITATGVRAAFARGSLRPARVVGEGRRATYFYTIAEVDRYARERQIGWRKGRPRKKENER